MSIEESVEENERGKFTYRKHDSSQEFVCDKCLEPKVSKNKIEWIDNTGKERIICNKCYSKIMFELQQ